MFFRKRGEYRGRLYALYWRRRTLNRLFALSIGDGRSERKRSRLQKCRDHDERQEEAPIPRHLRFACLF
ncbi:MAG: hypothetical protein DMF60_02810 [Acidobacteria bacterium]|nr:MAG: hypothetical protein DMF60_02810 [Acidobacteriota bacterium]